MSSLFWFRPIFMLELLIAESFFAKKLTPRKGFAWRLALGIILCVGIAFIIPYKIENGFYLSFMFILMFATTVILGIFCFDEPIKTVIFCAIAGYTVQHIASELCGMFDSVMSVVVGWQFDLYDVYNPVETSNGGIYLVLVHVVIYVWAYILLYKFAVPHVERMRVQHTNNTVIIALFTLIVFVDVIISALIMRMLPVSLLAALGRMQSLAVQLVIHGYNVLCCVLAIVIIIELPRRSGAERELAIVKQLYHEKIAQYETTKTNIELINMKYHDLKHRISVENDDMREIKEAVEIYDSAYKTANEALNIVLMEKSLICKHENINLSVIADASKLDFMKDADIYVLFGNIFDNAIEAVRKVQSADGRIIGLNIKTVNSFLIINVFNQYAGQIKMENGLPKTTKGDTRYHGFGLKSIKYIVQKYNGEMTIDVRELFNLTISFQLTA